MTTLTLSNCYTPLVVTTPSSSDQQVDPIIQSPTGISASAIRSGIVGSRSNGDGQTRSASQLRRLHLAVDISSTALGSSLVELGHSKVLCHVVHGDVNASNVEEGVVEVTVEWATNFGLVALPEVSGLDQHTAARTTSTKTMSVDYATKIKEALLPAMVSLQHLPKAVISVVLTILQDDGSILSACIMAASLALSNASLELYDLVTSCTVCCMDNGVVLVDPTSDELDASLGSLTLTMLYGWKEVTHWQQTGAVVGSKAMDLANEGCRTLAKFMRECLVQS